MGKKNPKEATLKCKLSAETRAKVYELASEFDTTMDKLVSTALTLLTKLPPEVVGAAIGGTTPPKARLALAFWDDLRAAYENERSREQGRRSDETGDGEAPPGTRPTR